MPDVQKTETILILVVVLVLAGVAARQITSLVHIKHLEHQQAESVNETQYFQSEYGIDVSGRPVTPLPVQLEDRTLIFLLRGSQLKSDLAFWRDASALVEPSKKLRLVGYCDGPECISGVRADGQALNFPVIAYGESTSAQALIAADLQDNAVLRSEQWFTPKTVLWRAAIRTPAAVIMEALK